MSIVTLFRDDRSRAQWTISLGFALLALVFLTAGLFASVNRPHDLRQVQQAARTPVPQAAVAPLNLVKPLTPEEAVKENQARPFDAPPDTPAKQFRLKTDEDSRDRALECMTQAVYYEAATESADGQRAVAQVVLNRMRHPGFPSTVCGVVYQGSQLPTGCQFTFTCDGSLTRAPIPAIWARAKKIALDALAGHVFAPVGHSTHYHADYVLPYWADSLAKQVQIGHHIFYRLRGGLGSGAAFSQHYAGREPTLPPPPSAVAVEATDQAEALLNSGLAGDHPQLAADVPALAAAKALPTQVVLADGSKGTLLIDQGAAPAATAKRPKREDCSASQQGSKQLLPASPNDLHAGSSATGC